MIQLPYWERAAVPVINRALHCTQRTHFLPSVLSKLIWKNSNITNSVFTKSDRSSALTKYARCQKCERLPRSQPRCSADVPCSHWAVFSLHQTWKRAAVIWTLAAWSVSAWTAAGADVRSEWIAGPAAWIIHAVYEWMFSIWPLGLQWNYSRPLKALKQGRQWECQRQMKLTRGGDGSFSAQGSPISHQWHIQSALRMFYTENFPCWSVTQHSESIFSGRQCDVYTTVSSVKTTSL